MKLIIENPEKLDLEDFSIWLLNLIPTLIPDMNIRNESLEKVWENYFQNTDLGWARDGIDNPIPPSINFIIDFTFKNLKLSLNGDNYIISVDESINLPNTDLNLYHLLSIMKAGNLSISPYNIINDIFDSFADNLQDLYIYYMNNLES